MSLPHRIAAGAVVIHQQRVLLVRYAPSSGGTYLVAPGGGVQDAEPLAQAAVRETLEETGWEVHLTCLLGVQQWSSQSGRQFVRFTFAADAVRHDPTRPLDTGILRALWLTRDEIAAAAERLRSPMVLAGVDDWLGGRRLPLDAIRWLTDEAGSNG